MGERVNLEADCMGKYAATAVGNVRLELNELRTQLRVAQAWPWVAVSTVAGGGAGGVVRRLFRVEGPRPAWAPGVLEWRNAVR